MHDELPDYSDDPVPPDESIGIADPVEPEPGETDEPTHDEVHASMHGPE